jgi:hypothetical protein
LAQTVDLDTCIKFPLKGEKLRWVKTQPRLARSYKPPVERHADNKVEQLHDLLALLWERCQLKNLLD